MARGQRAENLKVERGAEVGLGLVGLGGFCSNSDVDPPEGSEQRRNTVRLTFLIQHFGCCVKRQKVGRTASTVAGEEGPRTGVGEGDEKALHPHPHSVLLPWERGSRRSQIWGQQS